MNAEILTVGTEILLGDILNTNAQYLGKELALLGIGIYRTTSVGDNEERLYNAIKDALSYSDFVITTGGLGPTSDDISKEVSARVLGKDLILHKESYEKIKGYFRNNDRAMKNGNEKQALFPEDAIILENDNGTAPGCIMKSFDDKYIINLPGPPIEMIPMFEEKVRPFLEGFIDSTIVSRSLRSVGLGEWDLASRVADIIKESENPTVAPYAKSGEATLRITAKAKNKEEAIKLIDKKEEEILNIIGKYIYGRDNESLEDALGSLLLKHNLNISVAESLTGGMIMSKIVSYEGGISKSINEGYLTYSNEAKERILGVKKETIEKYGPASRETSFEMTKGLIEKTGCDVCITTTGIAGPSGGTKEKPVGLAYIGISIKGKIKIIKGVYSGSRESIRRKVSTKALDELRRGIIKVYES